jgi:hypothetical protein
MLRSVTWPLRTLACSTPQVRRATYPDCKAATVKYITDAGHTWPGTTVREGDKTTPADLPAGTCQ